MTRARESGLREQTLLVCTLIGTSQMTWGVIVPVLPVLVQHFSLSLALLGPVIAAFSLGRVLSNVPAAAALRRLAARPYLHLVVLALAAVTALTGLATNAPWLIAMRFTAGVFGGAAVTIGFAVLIVGAPAAERGRVMATATVVQMSAAALGSLLGGFVITVAPMPVVFLAASVPLILALGWDLLRPANRYWSAAGRGSTRGSRGDDRRAPVDLAGAGRSRPALLAALVVFSFAVFFARFAGEQGLIPVMAYAEGGLEPLGLGLAMAAGTLLSMAVLPLAGRRVDAGARVGMLLWPLLGAILALALMPLAADPLLFAVAIVLYSVMTSLVSIVPGVVTGEEFGPRESGFVVGLTRTAGDIGAAVGPLAVFAVADVAGNGAGVAVIGATLGLSAIWLAGVLVRRRATGRRLGDVSRPEAAQLSSGTEPA